jgi:hypothetical protein
MPGLPGECFLELCQPVCSRARHDDVLVRAEAAGIHHWLGRQRSGLTALCNCATALDANCRACYAVHQQHHSGILLRRFDRAWRMPTRYVMVVTTFPRMCGGDLR